MPDVLVDLARTTLRGNLLALEMLAPKRLEVAAGSTLLLRHHYELEEADRRREELRVGLHARMTDRPTSPVEQRIRDRPGLADDARGFIQEFVRLDQPGNYDVTFDVNSQHVVTSWLGRRVEELASRRGNGSVRIDVKPRADALR